MSTLPLLIFQLIVFIFSVIVHEVSHGVVALKLGDTTAKDLGRLTLNPLPHLELFGSFILPMALYILSGGSFVFGWAKPVPYDPSRLKNPRQSAGLIALAGPGSNLIVAAIFGVLARLMDSVAFGAEPIGLSLMFHIIVFVNVLLAVFNLLPLPPLDGSKVLFAVLPERFYGVRRFLEQYGFVILLLFITLGFGALHPLITVLYRLFAGSGGIL